MSEAISVTISMDKPEHSYFSRPTITVNQGDASMAFVTAKYFDEGYESGAESKQAYAVGVVAAHFPIVNYQTEWKCAGCELDYSNKRPGAKYESQVYQQHLIALIKGEQK